MLTIEQEYKGLTWCGERKELIEEIVQAFGWSQEIFESIRGFLRQEHSCLSNLILGMSISKPVEWNLSIVGMEQVNSWRQKCLKIFWKIIITNRIPRDEMSSYTLSIWDTYSLRANSYWIMCVEMLWLFKIPLVSKVQLTYWVGVRLKC